MSQHQLTVCRTVQSQPTTGLVQDKQKIVTWGEILVFLELVVKVGQEVINTQPGINTNQILVRDIG